MTINDLTCYQAAMIYAAQGWPVFPLIHRDKRPATSNGLHDATTDIATIEQWWDYGDRNYNLGIRCGGDAFDVLDVDDQSAFADWRHLHTRPPVPTTLTARTGSGGVHHMWTPDGTRNRTGFIPGCDWRGQGGYIVAPPSIHPNGTPYLWINWGTPIAGRPSFIDPGRLELPDGLEATITTLTAELAGHGSPSAVGQQMLMNPAIMANLGTHIKPVVYIEKAWAEEVELFAAVSHGRNDALYAAVMSVTRFGNVNATPTIAILSQIATRLIHSDHPEWGPLPGRNVANTIGSAIFRRFCLTANERQQQEGHPI